MVLIIQLHYAGTSRFKADVLLTTELDCTLNPDANVTTKQSVLESLSWNGTDYTTIAGTRILQNGCTADQVNLTVTQNQRMPLLQTICSGNFPWNGTDYTTTQAGLRILKTDVLQTSIDCNSPKPADALPTQKQSVLEVFLLEWY
jgi:hypothetical protein